MSQQETPDSGMDELQFVRPVIVSESLVWMPHFFQGGLFDRGIIKHSLLLRGSASEALRLVAGAAE